MKPISQAGILHCLLTPGSKELSRNNLPNARKNRLFGSISLVHLGIYYATKKVSAYGLSREKYKSVVQSEVRLDDLFKLRN